MNRVFIHCYRLLTGPKVGNLYPQLVAAKCPACSRSEKKVKPGCKHEESRPASPKCHKLPHYHTLTSEMIFLDWFFLRCFKPFSNLSPKIQKKKTLLCFFWWCNLRISVGAFFSCEDTKPESWKKIWFCHNSEIFGKKLVDLNSKNRT